eukprot:4268319-Alexandrium_andersonii.AAC.1
MAIAPLRAHSQPPPPPQPPGRVGFVLDELAGRDGAGLVGSPAQLVEQGIVPVALAVAEGLVPAEFNRLVAI